MSETNRLDTPPNSEPAKVTPTEASQSSESALTGSAITPVNPSTGQTLDPVPESSDTSILASVEARREAQTKWAKRSFEERADIIRAFVQRLALPENAEALAEMITREMGKPVKAARAELASVPGRIENYIDKARAALQSERSVEAKVCVQTDWCPLGVVAVIGPWNYPVSTPSTLILSALLTGNAVVAKPSEYVPRSGAMYGKLLRDSLPDPVFDWVQGGGRVGATLIDCPIDMVAFTGSIETGQRIMDQASKRMLRLVMELGGKDPMVVLPGADLKQAATYAARESTRNSGQVCVSVERIYVHESIHDEFVGLVQDEVAKLKVGDPSQEDTDIGPMANESQRRLVLEQISDAQEKGAQILLESKSWGPGFYLSPSIVTGVDESMALGSNETFGPVVAVTRFTSIDEMLKRLNASRYGLGASLWGPSERQGHELDEIANRIEAGMIGINRGLSAAAGAPWVGWKMSGYGYARSKDGMRQFLRPRTKSRMIE